MPDSFVIGSGVSAHLDDVAGTPVVYDGAGGLRVALTQPTLLGPFNEGPFAAGTTNRDANLGSASGSDAITIPWSGLLVGISAAVIVPVTAGSVTAKAVIDGSGVALTTTITAASPDGRFSSNAITGVPVSAGARLGLKIDTTTTLVGGTVTGNSSYALWIILTR